MLVTRNLVEAALRNKIGRFIFTSTGATYPYNWYDEALANTIPISYVRTKKLSELEVEKGMKRGLDAVILRPIVILGKYDQHNYSTIFEMMSSHGSKAVLPGHFVFCHAYDVAKAHLSAYEKSLPGQSYLLGGTHTTWLDAGQRICALAGTTPPTRPVPHLPLSIAAYVLDFIARFTRKKPLLTPEVTGLLKDSPDLPYIDQFQAKRDLGYESQSLDIMIRDHYNWLKSQGRLGNAVPKP